LDLEVVWHLAGHNRVGVVELDDVTHLGGDGTGTLTEGDLVELAGLGGSDDVGTNAQEERGGEDDLLLHGLNPFGRQAKFPATWSTAWRDGKPRVKMMSRLGVYLSGT